MRILVGYDGSQDSETALTSLRRAGLPAKAEVLVITVAAPWPVAALETESREYYGYDVDGAAEAALVPARKAAGKAARQLPRRFPGWTVKSEARVGMAAQSLLERAESWKPDLLVVGSPGHSTLRRMLLGDPKKRILAECRDWKTDCLFVGCRGLNSLDRFLIGSCSSGMAAHAPCPVEIIRNLHPASGRADPGRGRKREHA